MKEFIAPEMRTILFTVQDILTTSSATETTEPYVPSDPETPGDDFE